MTYDLDGNMLTRSGPGVNDTYTWNDFGQLVTVTRSGVTQATFAYDGFGRRIRKTSSSATVQYVWDGEQILGEADGSGAVTQTYSYYPGTDQLHSVTTAAGQTYYASLEPSGDVNGLVRSSDDSVVAQYAYTPWGALEADAQQVAGVRVNSLRWKGLPYDVETGLYQIRARYYDPYTRRFISEDPIGLAGGINEYVFANADPVNGNDPTGLDAACSWVAQVAISTMGVQGTPWYTVNREVYWVQQCVQSTDQQYQHSVPTLQLPTGQTTGGGVSRLDKITTAQCGRAAATLAFSASIDAFTWGQGGIVKAALSADVVKVVGLIGENAVTAARGLPVKHISVPQSQTLRECSLSQWRLGCSPVDRQD